MDLTRIIKILTAIAVLVILAILIYIFRGNIALNISDSVSQKSAFRDYKVDTHFKDGAFRVEIKDLVTSTGGMEKQYYRYDIMIDTEDKKSAKDIKKNSDQVAVILNSVMSEFRPDQIDTDAERMRLKRLMKDKIYETYPEIKINDLYFTNYVYN